ncbi:MAG: hypothetical protein M1822_001733 [Bathelium mastoideum]|nr:MAG: hypothetical protein M1822_001733 [Bathelium mastoideum]
MSSINSTSLKLLFTLLVAGVIAAPSPNPQFGTTPTQPAPGSLPANQCVDKPSSSGTEWGIYVQSSTMPSGSGSWAGGLLDALRNGANCNQVTGWQCQKDNQSGVGCTFTTPTSCQQTDVSNALNQAGGGWTSCNGNKMTDLFDANGNLYSAYDSIIPKTLTDLFSDFEQSQ